MRINRSSSFTIAHDPTSSTLGGPGGGPCAMGVAAMKTRSAMVIVSERRIVFSRLQVPAGHRLELRAIRLALEMLARRVIAGQILRIADVLRDRQPDVAVWKRNAVPVLDERRLIAVRHPVLPQPALDEVRRRHLQRARRRTAAGAADARDAERFPFSDRKALKRPRARRG